MKSKIKKKKINQIVLYFYTVSFLILLVALVFLAAFFSNRERVDREERLRAYVSSTQNRINSAVSSLQYMQKLVYSDAVYTLKNNDKNHAASILNTLSISRNLNTESVYGVLFDGTQNQQIITNDIESFTLPQIANIYNTSLKSKPYLTFFHDGENNPNAIYIYSSNPIIYYDTISVRNYIIGTSVLIAKISIPEYSRYFAYDSSVEISICSNGQTFYISKSNTSSSSSSEYSCDISGTDWKIYGHAFSGKNLFESQSLFKLFAAQAFLIIVCLLILFQIIYRSYIMKPINLISTFLGEYVILNRTPEIPQQNSYEFDKIAKYIVRMANKNRALVHQIFKNQQTIYEKEIENKSYRFYALKAQINPHFLYNTLDCISSLAYYNDVEPIADITNVLSKILRYTITEKPYTTVNDEVTLLENYFSIIKIRYPDRFNYRINMDKSLSNCKMLHMLLQPLTENSIKHNNLFARKLIVYIKIYASENHLNCIIMDNGVGMSAEKTALLNESLSKPVSSDTPYSPDSGHIGIHNINSRIKLMCGNEYGIHISGVENKYIKISVKIPIEFSNDTTDKQ